MDTLSKQMQTSSTSRSISPPPNKTKPNGTKRKKSVSRSRSRSSSASPPRRTHNKKRSRSRSSEQKTLTPPEERPSPKAAAVVGTAPVTSTTVTASAVSKKWALFPLRISGSYCMQYATDKRSPEAVSEALQKDIANVIEDRFKQLCSNKSLDHPRFSCPCSNDPKKVDLHQTELKRVVKLIMAQNDFSKAIAKPTGDSLADNAYQTINAFLGMCNIECHAPPSGRIAVSRRIVGERWQHMGLTDWTIESILQAVAPEPSAYEKRMAAARHNKKTGGGDSSSEEDQDTEYRDDEEEDDGDEEDDEDKSEGEGSSSE